MADFWHRLVNTTNLKDIEPPLEGAWTLQRSVFTANYLSMMVNATDGKLYIAGRLTASMALYVAGGVASAGGVYDTWQDTQCPVAGSNIAQIGHTGYTLFVLTTTGELWIMGEWGRSSGTTFDTPPNASTNWTNVTPSGKQVESMWFGCEFWGNYGHPAKNANAMFICTDGDIWATGINEFGEIGAGGNFAYSELLSIDLTNLNGDRPIAINHSCDSGDAGYILTQEGNVYGFGRDRDFRFGIGAGAQTTFLIPTKIPQLSNIVALVQGYQNAIALDTSGTVWVVGDYDPFEQLQLFPWVTTTGTLDTWTPYPLLQPCITIGCGDEVNFYRYADGTVWVEGRNYRFGGGAPFGGINSDIPFIENPALTQYMTNKRFFISETVGYYVLSSEFGKYRAWADNGEHQLGWDTDSVEVTQPTFGTTALIPHAVGLADIFSDQGALFVIREDGRLFAGGRTDYGTTGTGNSRASWTGLTHYSSPGASIPSNEVHEIELVDTGLFVFV